MKNSNSIPNDIEIEENTTEKSSKKTTIIMVICFCVFIFGFMCLLFCKPNNSKVKVRKEVKVERAEAKNLSKIPSKTPVIRVGEKFKFKISRDVFFNGNMNNVYLTIKVPQDEKNRQKISNLKIEPKPQRFVEKSDGKYAVIFLRAPRGKTHVSIEGEAVVRTYNLAIAEKINKNIDKVLTEEEKQSYLKEEEGLDTTSRLINMSVKTQIPTATNDVDTVKNIFDFVFEHMTYDKMELNKNKGALRAFQSGRGVCEEFADLFVSLCRVKGIPAKVVEGFDLPFLDEQKDFYTGHTWAEVYFPEYGWVTFDPTNSVPQKIKKQLKKLEITPYDFLSKITKYKTYLILDSKMITAKYEGSGSISSKNLKIDYDKI